MAPKGSGALVFKGDSKRKASEQKYKRKRSSEETHTGGATSLSHTLPSTTTTSVVAAAAVDTRPTVPTATTALPPQLRLGTGRITTSGSVVTGYGTRFTTELGVGDALLVHLPKKVDSNGVVSIGSGSGVGSDSSDSSSSQEMRIVTMCLSDISLNLSSAFTSSLSTPVSFHYVPKPRNFEREAAVAHERRVQTQRDEWRHNGSSQNASSSNSKPSSDELVYRERTEHGNYRTKRAKVSTAPGDTTDRSDFLALRTKKTSDKYC